MDSSSNSFGDAQVVPVVRTERVGAYDSSNLRKRQNPQQEQGKRSQQPQPEQPVSDDVRQLLNCEDDQDPHGNLDVTA